MRIHGASPEFIRDLKSLGYDRLPAQDLVSMRIHGASSEFVRELKSLGYDRLPAQELVSMRIHGASPEFVRDMKSLGYECKWNLLWDGYLSEQELQDKFNREGSRYRSKCDGIKFDLSWETTSALPQ